jgi:membrane protein
VPGAALPPPLIGGAPARIVPFRGRRRTSAMLMPDLRQRAALLTRKPVERESPVPDRAICWRMAVHLLRTAQRHRITGHAAEMAFFAVLTLVPSTVAVGSALGLFRKVLGPDAVKEAESAMTGAVRTLMGPDLADTAISPFVHAQLAQPRGGVALGGLLVAWWLASHLFASTGHALDAAYGVRDRRPTLVHRLLALAFALGSVLLVAVTVEVMVVGPFGNAKALPLSMLSDQYQLLWSIVRWPIALVVVVAFLVCLYRFSANVPHSWRQCVPGALLGAGLWILAAAAFRVSASLGLRNSIGVASDDPSVRIIGQSVNAVVATVLWAYLASIAILIGGEFNAALRARSAAR